MTMAGLYKNPTIYPLFALIEELQQGSILLPGFQRPFVWNDDKRLALLDSVRRGMPIGSMLVWSTEKHRLSTPTNLKGWTVGGARATGPWTYLIDGHQRLMTLLTAFTEPGPSRNDEPEEDRIRWPAYYDLQQQELTFGRRGRGAKVSPFWMPLNALISNKSTYDFSKPLYAAGHTIEGDRAEALRNRFSEYLIPVIPMVTDDFMTVTLGFQRINSGSTPMNEVHMLHAVIAALGVDLFEELEKARKKYLAPLGQEWADIEDEDILVTTKLALGFGVYERDPEVLAKEIANDPACIEQAAHRLAEAARFLAQNCGVLTLKQFLPYRYQLVLMTMAFAQGKETTKREHEILERWFWRTSFLEIFAGISEGRLNQVTRHLRATLAGEEVATERWFEGTVEGPPNPAKDSARLRAIRALLACGGSEQDEIQSKLDQWRQHSTRTHEDTVFSRLERAKVVEVGLKYAHTPIKKAAQLPLPEAPAKKG